AAEDRPPARGTVATRTGTGPALATALDRGATLAPGLGAARHRDGGAAHVHRRGDRGHHLVAAEDRPPARSAVATRARAGTALAAALDRGAALAGRVGAAEDRDRVTADVHRRGDRRDHLVAAEDRPPARGAVATRVRGRVALDDRAAVGPRLGPTEDADGVAADVDREGDRQAHLVAAADRVVAVGVGERGAAAGEGHDAEREQRCGLRALRPSAHRKLLDAFRGGFRTAATAR